MFGSVFFIFYSSIYYRKLNREVNRMLLKTDSLCIRRIIESDWKSIKNIWEDFNASEYAQYDKPHCTNDRDVCERIKRWADTSCSTEHMFFAICLNEAVIGYIAFNQRDYGYELGYCFHSDYHGMGYAKESHTELFTYLYSYGISRITAGTALNNLPSVNLLKSLGFRQIGSEKVSFHVDNEGNAIYFDGGIFELIISEKQYGSQKEGCLS